MKRDQKILKTHDDAAASFINEHVGAEMMREIEINPRFLEWRNLSFSNTDRSVLFTRMLKVLFSSGNASDAVDAMMHLFGQKQDPNEHNPSAFINQVNEAYASIVPLIEDPDNKGTIKALQLQTMVLIHGFNRSDPFIKDGIKAHLDAHPKDALSTPGDLIAAIMKAYTSDLNEERISEQSAAFAATTTASPKLPAKKKAWKWHADNKDHSAIPGEVHCPNCHKLTSKFFYTHNPDKCNRTAESEKAYQVRKAANLHAKAAVVASPAPAEASELERVKTELAHAKETNDLKEQIQNMQSAMLAYHFKEA